MEFFVLGSRFAGNPGPSEATPMPSLPCASARTGGFHLLKPEMLTPGSILLPEAWRQDVVASLSPSPSGIREGNPEMRHDVEVIYWEVLPAETPRGMGEEARHGVVSVISREKEGGSLWHNPKYRPHLRVSWSGTGQQG